MWKLRNLTLLFYSSLCFMPALYSADFNVTVAATHAAAPMRLGLVTLGQLDERLSCLADQLARDLELSGQFKIEIREGTPEITSVAELKKFNQQQLPLVIFLDFTDQQKSELCWRLYDTVNAKMLVGKRIRYRHLKWKHLAHEVADQVWSTLVGQASSFKTVIVACQRQLKAGGKYQQHIYAFHVTDGLATSATHAPQCLVAAPTINLAPRFHPTRPLLYFSQQTVRNVRLMSLDRRRQQRIVADFNGLNLTPAISPQGTTVLTLTWDGKSRLCQYLPGAKHGKYHSLTGPEIHAVAPQFINQDRILFCAINAKNLPRIAIYDLPSQTLDYISDHHYAVSPAYCPATQQLVYCQKVGGVQQLFIGQLGADNQVRNLRQLTFSKGDKDNASWSPCGTYLVYSEETAQQSRLVLYNCLTQQPHYLTPAGAWWSFPVWSPSYVEIPFI